jgi:tripartite-type tricarboxylate transporter receptor subunit TctC
MKKKLFGVALCVFSLCSLWAGGKGEASGSAASGGWPQKPVQIIVPYNPGGDTDFNARAYTTKLEAIIGKPVVVTNVAGNGGAIGATQVKNSAADGYTALIFHTSMFVNKTSGATDFGLESFELSAIIGRNAGNVICVSSKSPYNSLKDLVDASLKNPGKIATAVDLGATTYLMGALLNKAGAKLNLVDMGSSPQRAAALLGGHVDAIINPLGTALPYLDSKDFRALALVEGERNSVYNHVPTAIEQGYQGVTLPIYYFLAFPKGTPKDIVEKMAAACSKVFATDEYKKSILDTYKQSPFFLSAKEAYDVLAKQEKDMMGMKDLLK